MASTKAGVKVKSTLLLSQGYEPIAAISWQRAISMLTLGKCEVVEQYEQAIRSRYLVLKMPAVVRLIQRFRRRKHPVKFSKCNVLARDRWKCQYCSASITVASMTQDHVVPRSQGGRTCWENIVASCAACNVRKADKTPEQAGMRLRCRPRRPDWVPVHSVRLGGAPPAEWASYLHWATGLEIA